jgi:hypothetical protein
MGMVHPTTHAGTDLASPAGDQRVKSDSALSSQMLVRRGCPTTESEGPRLDNRLGSSTNGKRPPSTPDSIALRVRRRHAAVLNRSCSGIGVNARKFSVTNRNGPLSAKLMVDFSILARSGVDHRSHSRLPVGMRQVGDAMPSGHAAVAFLDGHRDLELKIQPRDGI